MVILMRNLMKMVDKQNAREHKRAKREEKRDRDRSRSARRKFKKDDSDDEPCFDTVGALARFDLQINVSRLPAMKEIMTLVRQAKKAVRVGICPMVSGKLDRRFLPSCQATAEWAKALDPEKPRLMTWQTLWWGRASCQLIIQSLTTKPLLNLGQIHDWWSNVQLLALNEGVPTAVEFNFWEASEQLFEFWGLLWNN